MSIDFSCQDKTPELCAQARAILSSSKVVIVGIGALGTTACDILLRSGCEHLTLIDDDVVAGDNLPRQTLFGEADVGKKKVLVAQEKLLAINGQANIEVVAERLSEQNVALFSGADIILDCTDNIPSRLVIDEYCDKQGIAWVHAAAVGRVGEVMAIVGGKRYADLVSGKHSDDDCASVGIMTIASVMTATLQASIALRVLLGRQDEVVGKLFRLDAWKGSIEFYRV